VLSGDSIRVVHPLFPTEGDGSTPISPLQLEVAEIDMRLAQSLNELWHSRLPVTHLGNLVGNHANVAYGAMYENRFYATAIWTEPVARMLNGKGLLELRRMAIADDAPKNTASRMLSIMRRMIHKKFPHLTRLISYQDTEVHHGTIYKSAGWVATNRSTVNGKGWNTRKRAAMQTTADKIRWEINL
jgi:hypothetical protein